MQPNTSTAEQVSTVLSPSIAVPAPEALTPEVSASADPNPIVAACPSETAKRKRGPANYEPLPATARGMEPASPAKTRPSSGRTDGGYDPQLEWLIQSGDAALGASGTLAGVVSQIERGSVGGSGRLDAAGTFQHPYTDLQLGAGVDGIGEVELHRYAMAAWRLVSPAAQFRLCRRYSAVKAQFRSDSGFGAKDRWVDGSDHREGQHGMQRFSVEDHLGAFAALALELCPDPIKLVIACMEPDPVRKGKTDKSEKKRRAALVEECLHRAHEADHADHAEWFAAKARVPALRTFKDRTGRERNQSAAAAGLSYGRPRPVERSPRRRSGISVDDATFERAVDRAFAGDAADADSEAVAAE